MVPYWLKPNKVGIAFFVIFAILILYVFSFFVLFPCRWLWYLVIATLLLAAYPISMLSGRSIENRRKLKAGLVSKEPVVENRLLGWFCLIAFLVIVAIPLDLGCYLLSPASYFRHFASPPRIDSPRPIVFWFAYGFPIVLAIVLMILRWNTAFIIFLTGAILLERFCAGLAFHTIGEVVSALYHMVICLNIIPIIFYAVKFRKIAVVIILALALLLIPHQLFLGYRFIQLQDEAHAIVEYVYKTKAQTGSYPKDLSEYTFKNPHLKKHIQRYDIRGNEFTLSYYVGTTGTSHWYDSEGGWDYYPD